MKALDKGEKQTVVFKSGLLNPIPVEVALDFLKSFPKILEFTRNEANGYNTGKDFRPFTSSPNSNFSASIRRGALHSPEAETLPHINAQNEVTFRTLNPVGDGDTITISQVPFTCRETPTLDTDFQLVSDIESTDVRATMRNFIDAVNNYSGEGYYFGDYAAYETSATEQPSAIITQLIPGTSARGLSELQINNGLSLSTDINFSVNEPYSDSIIELTELATPNNFSSRYPSKIIFDIDAGSPISAKGFKKMAEMLENYARSAPDLPSFSKTFIKIPLGTDPYNNMYLTFRKTSFSGTPYFIFTPEFDPTIKREKKPEFTESQFVEEEGGGGR